MMGFFDLFKEPDIEKMYANKEFDGLIKCVKSRNVEIRNAAIEALYKLRDMLKIKSLKPLSAALGDSHEDVTKRVKSLIDYIMYQGWQKIETGMRQSQVVDVIGYPDERMRGREFISKFRVGVIMNRGNNEFLDLEHWVYRMKENTSDYYLVVFKDGRVEHHSAHRPSWDKVLF